MTSRILRQVLAAGLLVAVPALYATAEPQSPEETFGFRPGDDYKLASYEQIWRPTTASSFDCERLGRRHLVETWQEQRLQHDGAANTYLDTLAAFHRAGWLDEYVAHYHRRDEWQLPEALDINAFRAWHHQHHPSFRPETRLIGSWNYAHNVNALP